MGNGELGKGIRIDAPMDCDRFRGGPCGDRPRDGYHPRAGSRDRTRHGDAGRERGARPWRGDPRGRLGRVRADGRTGNVRDRQHTGRLVRGPRAARAPDRGPPDGDRRSRWSGDAGLRARAFPGPRGRDRHRLGGRHRDDVRGVQRRHHPGLVRHHQGVCRQPRRCAPERAGGRQPQLRPRVEPADHPRLRRRPGAHPRGRAPHGRSLQPVGRSRRDDRSERRRADRDRARAGDPALRVERGRRPGQHHHAARELPRVALRRHAGAVRHQRGQRERRGGHHRQPAVLARQRARLGRREHAAHG